MNIPSISAVSALQQAAVRQQIDTALLAKANNIAKDQAKATLGLLRESGETVEPAGGDGDSDDGRSLNLIA